MSVAVIAFYLQSGSREWHPSGLSRRTNNLLLVVTEDVHKLTELISTKQRQDLDTFVDAAKVAPTLPLSSCSCPFATLCQIFRPGI